MQQQRTHASSPAAAWPSMRRASEHSLTSLTSPLRTVAPHPPPKGPTPRHSRQARRVSRDRQALHHPWLQPVTDENTRNVLSLKLPDGAIERRNARKHARQRLRASIQSVVAARRLSRGSAQSDAVGSDDTEVVVVQPLSSEALRAHSEQDVHDMQPASPSKGRRGSNASSASYHSDDMAPRAI